MIFLLLFLLINNVYSSQEYNTVCKQGDDGYKYAATGRLPDFVKPKEYRISYMFDSDLKSYIGRVMIEVEVINRTDTIILHSAGNLIRSVEVNVYKDYVFFIPYLAPIDKICFIPDQQFMVIKLKQFLEKNFMALITVKFVGNISDHFRGIYKIDHPIKKYDKMKIISTFFEPTYARLAYPCFDEPSFKAVFKLDITYPKEYTAVSNTASLTKKQFDQKLTTSEFEQTPLMSTYLLGFVLFDFTHTTAKTRSGVDINIWLPQEYLGKSEFVLKYASEVFQHYEHNFKISYPLKKLDIIGILPFPRYTGTEHFGLISISTISLMVEEKESRIQDKQQSLKAIGHLIAHQWFGNILTMSWWNDLWLKEGFATYFSFNMIYENHPELKIVDLISYELLSYLWPIDQTKTIHPLALPQTYKGTPQEIYDHVPYYKGAEVVDLINYLVGKENLLKILRDFLNVFAYSTATTDDLLQLIKAKTGEMNYRIVKKVIENPGIPLVSVEKSKDPGTFNIVQERCVVSTDKNRHSSKIYQDWIIPINYTAESINPLIKRIFLNKHSDKIILDGNDKWININFNFSLYYRSEYKSGLLAEITEILKKKITTFSEYDRCLFVSDAFAMVSLGKQPVKYAFDHFESLRGEEDFCTLALFFEQMEYVKKLIYEEDFIEKFTKYVLGFSLDLVKKFGWNRISDDFKREVQILAISKSISFGDQQTIDNASELYKNPAKRKNYEYLMPHLGCAYVKKYGSEAFREILRQFLRSNNSNEAMGYLTSLLCSNDQNMLKLLLDHLLLNLRPTFEIPYVIIAVSQNPLGAPVALQFVVKNHEKLFHLIGQDLFVYVRQIPIFMSSYKTSMDLEILKELFEEYDMSPVKTAIDMGVEFLKQNIFWIKTNKNDLKVYLSKI